MLLHKNKTSQKKKKDRTDLQHLLDSMGYEGTMDFFDDYQDDRYAGALSEYDDWREDYFGGQNVLATDESEEESPVIEWTDEKKNMVRLNITSQQDVYEVNDPEVKAFLKREAGDRINLTLRVYYNDIPVAYGTIQYSNIDRVGYKIILNTKTDAFYQVPAQRQEAPVNTSNNNTAVQETTPSAQASAQPATENNTSAAMEAAPKERTISFDYDPSNKKRFNNTGFVFRSSDGTPPTMDEIYLFIYKKKKAGDPLFKKTFPKQLDNQPHSNITFEVEGSQYTYYEYLFKGEEPKEDPNKGAEVNLPGVVRADAGIRLHETPSPADPAYKKNTGDAAIIYPQNTTLTILNKGNDKNPGWVLVRTKDGKEGWIEEVYIRIVDSGYNKTYTLDKVESGDNVEGILRGVPGLDRDIGKDNRAFAYVLLMMNPGNPGVYINMDKYNKDRISLKNGLDSEYAELRAIYQSIELREGYTIKVPTKEGIDQMISSGAVPTRPEEINAKIKGARVIQGLMEGIPLGFAEQAGDTATGMWDMVKSIFTGEILDMLGELYDQIENMTWEDFMKLVLGMIGVDPEEFKEIWNATNIRTEDRYKYFGEIIGRILFEVAFEILTGGAALGALAAKAPALAKVMKAMDKSKALLKSKLSKTSQAALIPIAVIKRNLSTILARYPDLRNALSAVQRILGNVNYAKFEEYLRGLPDDVLKKLQAEPDLMEAFAKKAINDPDFAKAVQNGDIGKLDELKVNVKKIPFNRSQVGKTINNSTKQAEHIKDSKPYLNRIKVKGEYPSTLKSDPQKLLDDFHSGKGTVVADNPAHKSVVVRFDEPIGDVIDQVTGQVITPGTHYGAIKYGTNVHIVPVNF